MKISHKLTAKSKETKADEKIWKSTFIATEKTMHKVNNSLSNSAYRSKQVKV